MAKPVYSPSMHAPQHASTQCFGDNFMTGRNDDRPKGSIKPAEARADRLAAELRSNLARRKARARALAREARIADDAPSHDGRDDDGT
jgi:hypothetical protein